MHYATTTTSMMFLYVASWKYSIEDKEYNVGR